jgi:hypothetical protein
MASFVGNRLDKLVAPQCISPCASCMSYSRHVTWYVAFVFGRALVSASSSLRSRYDDGDTVNLPADSLAPVSRFSKNEAKCTAVCRSSAQFSGEKEVECIRLR